MYIKLDIQVAALLISLLTSVTAVDSGCLPSLKCNCTSTYGTVRCQGGKAPCTIPSNTENVYITDFNLVEKNQHPFNDLSWQNVSLLDLSIDVIKSNSIIEARCFMGLAKLEYLGIHTIPRINPNFINVHIALLEESLYGLENLRKLDLSGNPLLSLSNMVISLKNSSVVPNLESLNLNFLSQRAGTNVDIGELFFRTLSTRPIKSLSFDNTTIRINYNSLYDICNTLEEFSARSSTITIYQIERTSKFPKCKILSKTDISNSKIAALNLILENTIKKPNKAQFQKLISAETIDKYFGFLFTAKKLYLNTIISNFNINSDIVFDFKNYKTTTKILQFRGNNIQCFNVSITNIVFPPGTELYISDNMLTYIHPKSLYPGKNIRKLDLSKNKLHVMADQHPKDFATFLHVFSDLKILNLSFNGLTYIPYDMFQPGISNLTNIDLSWNHLKTFSMKWENFNCLQYLNVSQNEIASLDATQMETINSFVATANKREVSVRLNLGENPYKCMCTNLEFPAWVRSSDFVVKDDKLQCDFDGVTFDMKYEAFEQIRSSCDHQKTVRIFLITSGTCLCVILVTIASFIVIRRQKRQKHKINQVLKQIKNGDWADRFLIFLSFSSEDGDFVMEHIYPKLNLNLQALTGTIQDFICVGERNFRPGYPIIDEVISTMKLSSVAIFVVSKSFCEKRWCEMEVREAYENQKPIILMCMEEVKENLMSPLLLKLFHRNTRSKVMLNQNGECISQPNWLVLCSSVIQLTSEKFKTRFPQRHQGVGYNVLPGGMQTGIAMQLQ